MKSSLSSAELGGERRGGKSRLINWFVSLPKKKAPLGLRKNPVRQCVTKKKASAASYDPCL